MAGIGDKLKDRYLLKGELGRGGMSVVYLAEDEQIGKRYAVKKCFKARGGDPAGPQTDVQAQAALMKKLNHPSIPHVEEVLEDDEALYIVMDCVSGQTLDRVLREQGPLPQRTVVRIGVQLCAVLGYLHTLPRPVICRDVKPSNIMFCDGDRMSISLFDFDIARECDGPFVSADLPLGTKGYAAPEQKRQGGRLDARTDIFGLGSTMYALVTGRSPAEDGQICPITCWNGGLSADLERVILRCTETEPEDRYQDCAALRRALLDCSLSDETGARGEEAPSEGSGEKCGRCRYDPACCAPRHLEGDRDGVWERTADLDETDLMESGDQTGAEMTLEEARRKLRFRPDVKIVVCEADDRD